MSNGFNLNVFSYTNDELLDLLSIQKSCTADNISWSCDKLRDRLFSDNTKSKSEKAAINGFLRQVKVKLIKEIPTASSDELMIRPDASAIGPEDYNKKEFAPTYPSKHSAKNLNPIKRRLITRTLNIDTRFRNNYDNTVSTNIHLDLPTVIKNAISMKLVGLELPPCPIYTINGKYNNNFLHETTDGGINWSIVTIAAGNYTGDEIVAEIAAQTIATAATFDDKNCKITITFANNTNGFAFNRDKDGNIISNTKLGLGWMLGFLDDEYLGTVTAEAPYDGAGAKYLYLVVDDYNNSVNNYFIAAFNESILSQNILARLPQYSRNEEENNKLTDDINDLATIERTYFGPIHVQKLTIQLLDEYGRIVDLNKRDYSIALEFKCIYN